MAGPKTVKNDKSVSGFLHSVNDDQKRGDCLELLEMMERLSREKASMWGDSIVGFGSYHYKYQSGREGDWPVCGFSPRRQNLSLYLMSGTKPFAHLLEKLGKHKTSVACLYIKRLADVDRSVLEEIITRSIKATTGRA